MSRVSLDQPTLEAIDSGLADLAELSQLVPSLDPSLISMSFTPQSDVPVAAVCFMDLLRALQDVRYALFEAQAHGIWHREKSDEPSELAAIVYERFYYDDAALRFYAAGEYLAEAIRFMLEIDDAALAPYEKDRTSRQSILGHYLVAEAPAHAVTLAVKRLVGSAPWTAAMDYRNRWVHDQPPLIRGLGINCRRERRWKRAGEGQPWRLGLGGGDAPELTSTEIGRFVTKAFTDFIEAAQACLEAYLEILKARGISLDRVTGVLSLDPGRLRGTS